MDFRTEDERILAKVVTGSFTNIQKGDNVILRRINNMFQHPNSCYVDSTQTGKWLGRYPTKAFEVIRRLEDNESIDDLMNENDTEQQLSLF
ncbi:hypothetical protein QTG56_23605 (plasmid) [Rossellomorea sp. AcN35-11]|nr:hypothetical protein [Rossellomorea aquimaris]WJV32350.1 hypothetical protein QTG56_23605 [Rossellomorea sp. AcN35-11]